jgi:histidinol-phosphate/aromatic aminotransferase/cobyric acid decarboxylase-like protein
MVEFFKKQPIHDLPNAKFIEELKKFKIKYIDTHANFFHIYLGSKKKYFEEILKKNKILVRKGPGVEGYENYIRISLGSKDQMRKIILLLKKVLG